MLKQYKRKCPKPIKRILCTTRGRICNILPEQTATTKKVTALELKGVAWAAMTDGWIKPLVASLSVYPSSIPRTHTGEGEKQPLTLSSDFHTQLWCWLSTYPNMLDREMFKPFRMSLWRV